ncbi:unnamed protein product [Calicophoron daubneyi]|uniref:Clu domain-containing protein n=1 Tax=Calicophoron daubneyi TaxID=300641 RepID=A0AAV2TDH8_CALDB
MTEGSVNNQSDSSALAEQQPSQTNGADKSEIEVLEDAPYTVKIVPSHSEPFELQVSSFELVQEIHRVLMDREETCNCTCFSLALNGQTLDMFAELKTVEGLADAVEIKVVEERYSVREAKNHVKHVHDLLYSVELYDAYAGREQMSLSFVNSTTGDLEQKAAQSRPDSRLEFAPPEYVLPGYTANPSHDLPLCPLHPLEQEGKPIRCVRQLNYSNWNPPPPPRRLLGDLIYLFFHTLEDKRYHITACPRGFYVNMSTEEEFNPHPVQHAYVAHSLIDLLRQLSPGFKRNFEALLKRRAAKHPFERVPSPYQVYSWLAPSVEHTPDSVRKEEAFSSRMACEENLPGQTRDWNEELQVTHELPQTRLTERLLRDRAIFKSNSDFVAAATRAAVSVVNGDIMAINPGETRKQQMFIWNNMFFSLGFDVKEHYKEFGGEYAAYVATSSDLSGVRAYSMLDQPGLHTLGTAIVDYRGYRVTAQTIIPGILEKEQEQLVVYGSIDFGKTVLTDDRYKELLSKTAKQLKIRPHKVVNHTGEEVELFSSIDCKGIVGNDNRTYILDLLRTFPPDLNYFGACPAEIRPQLSSALTEMGYPYSHRHLLSTLRQELIEAFFEYRHETFLRIAALEIQKAKAVKATIPEAATNGGASTDEHDTNSTPEQAAPAETLNMREDALPQQDQPYPKASENPPDGMSNLTSKKMPINKSYSEDLVVMKKLLEKETSTEIEDLTQDAIRKAAKAVGSVCDDRFELLFNPDICQKFVKFCDSEAENLKADQALVCDACDFLVTKQIPAFAKDCISLCVTPQDGRALVEILHQRGVNVRYLNRVVEVLNQKPSLAYLKRLAITEILVRSAKHIFKNYLQEVDPMLLSVGVAHFFNCFLTACSNLAPLAGVDEQVLKLNKNKKGKKKPRNLRESPEEMAWASETPTSLWAELTKEAKEYFHYNISATDIDSFCTQHDIQRVQILRSFCPVVGVQLLLRDYSLNPPNGAKHHTKPVFTTEDIVSMYPVVKHLHPHATDAYHYFTSGQTRISAGHLQEGFELINEALSLLNGVYGPLHPDIGACNRLLARLSYVMGEHQAALLFQHRATMISERVHGIDNPNTITEYVHFALYCFACGHISPALQLLYRARYIALLCHGESHPEMTQIDTNIGLMLQLVGELDLALLFLENALTLSRIFYGERNLKEAFTCHLISRTYTYRGDFRSALDYEKRRFAIYKDRLGPDNDYTRDSDECLRHLTQQAVIRARKVAELASSGSGKGGSPTDSGHSSGKAHLQSQTSDNAEGAVSPTMALRSLLPGPLASYSTGIPVPTVASILETLNRVNGILVIQLRSQDSDQLNEDGDEHENGQEVDAPNTSAKGSTEPKENPPPNSKHAGDTMHSEVPNAAGDIQATPVPVV